MSPVGRLRSLWTDAGLRSLVGVVLVALLGTVVLVGSVLDRPITERSPVLTVRMDSTGGLFEGSIATYRGARVGRVVRIDVDGEGVVAQVRLDAGAQVPAASLVRVRSLSPIGEQFVDFRPLDDAPPYLADGDEVSAEVVDVPTTLAATVRALDGLLDQVDEEQLRTVLAELTTGLDGSGGDLGRLVDRADLLLGDLEGLLPETERVLVNGGDVLATLDDSGSDLRALARSSRVFAAFLRDYDPELRAQLRRGPGRLDQLGELVDEVAEVLPPFLRSVNPLLAVTDAYEPHLRELLAGYAPGLGVVREVVRDGFLNIEALLQADQRCDYGTPERSPRNPERRPARDDGRCAPSPTLQRGAAEAPGPRR